MARLAGAVSAQAKLSNRETFVLALVECLRARRELQAGNTGSAQLSAVVAVTLARQLEGDEVARPLGGF